MHHLSYFSGGDNLANQNEAHFDFNVNTKSLKIEFNKFAKLKESIKID